MAINLGMITFGLGATTAGLAAARAVLQQLAQAINAVGTAAASTGQQITGLTQQMRQLSSVATLVAGPLSGIATRLTTVAVLAERFNLQTAAMVVGIAAGVYAFYKLSTAIISTERTLQGVASTLTAVYGNVTIANLQFSYLTDLANRSGVSFNVLAKQYSQLEAASKGTNLEGERTRKVFEAIVFASAKLGLSTEETEGTLRAIQQIISKGTVQMEELKGQLGDRLPGALQIMAKALDVTVPKLNQMIQKGEVGASSLSKFADALTKRYNIDTSQKIDTIAASEARLSTARMVALDQLDKIVGVSSAYKKALDYIADGLSGASSKSADFIKIMLQLGAAFAAAFIAPKIVDAIGAITFGIARLASGIWALNAATAAGAFTSFVKLLVTATVAIGAYYASEKLVSEAIGKTAESYLRVKPAVEDYITAQKSLVTSVRGPTQDYIKQQNELLDQQIKQRNDIAESQKVTLEWADTLEKAGMNADQVSKQLEGMGRPRIDVATKQVQALDEQIAHTKQNIQDLNKILDEQTKKENNPAKDPAKDLTTRQEVTIKKAEETIRNLDAKRNNLFLSPAAKQYADTQEEINHQVELFKENLERAEIPAAKIASLVAGYRKSFSAFKEGENQLKNMVSGFQFAADAAKKFGDAIATNLVDALVDGKDVMTALQDTAKQTVKLIISEFIKLAAIAPLMNSLFGTNYQTLGGNAGVGGLLGGLFGGGTSASSATTGSIAVGGYNMPTVGFAGGGIMTQWGQMPLRKYARGGIASGPQAAIYGEGSQNEAFVPLPDGRRIPVAMQGGGGGGGGTEIHIHPPSGHQTKQSSSSNNKGGVKIDVEFVNMVRGAFQQDISEGGTMSQSIERQYGLNRAKGIG